MGDVCWENEKKGTHEETIKRDFPFLAIDDIIVPCREFTYLWTLIFYEKGNREKREFPHSIIIFLSHLFLCSYKLEILYHLKIAFNIDACLEIHMEMEN